MNLWSHRFSKLATQKFEGFLNWEIWSWKSLDIGQFDPIFCIFNLCMSYVLKVILTTFWLSFKQTFMAEILQIFELLIWKIDDFINSFWLYLTFRKFNFLNKYFSVSWNVWVTLKLRRYMYKTDNKGIKKKEKMRLINFRLLLNSVIWVIGIF